ncbi:unnamed protein product [Effrenium voratum]|nr:unnamed protein product [Effrenium voratum]
MKRFLALLMRAWSEEVVVVYTYADQFDPMLCHLARTVEAAGGQLQVLGLHHGKSATLGGLEQEGDHPWHFEDKSVMLKKHLFLQKAIRHLPGNATVVFVDAFDVLFQRPIEELRLVYEQLAMPHWKVQGRWPVIYGGDVNCWPFPHNGRVRVKRGDGNATWLYRISPDASLSAAYHSSRRFPTKWGAVTGSELCGEWLFRSGAHAPERRKNGQGPPPTRQRSFPFLCSGTFVGRAAAVRGLLRRMFAMFQETKEYHDQALLQVLLLRFPELGFVDSNAQLFLGLHGHNEFWDLERPLCRGDYFRKAEESQRAVKGLLPPRLLMGEAPTVIHFNGNGKRHMSRCVEAGGRFSTVTWEFLMNLPRIVQFNPW